MLFGWFAPGQLSQYSNAKTPPVVGKKTGTLPAEDLGSDSASPAGLACPPGNWRAQQPGHTSLLVAQRSCLLNVFYTIFVLDIPTRVIQSYMGLVETQREPGVVVFTSTIPSSVLSTSGFMSCEGRARNPPKI